MTLITLEGSVTAGTSFDSAAQEMQRVANRLDVCVRVQFNEVVMTAVPGGRAEYLATSAFARRLSPQPYFNGAFSHNPPSEEDERLVREANAARNASIRRLDGKDDGTKQAEPK